MGSLAELAVRIRARVEEFEKGIRTVTDKLKSMADKAVPASQAVAKGLLAIGAAAVGLGIKAISMAADLEQVEVAFGTLLGSTEAADKMIRDLQNFAATTPFQFPGLADAARMLVAFGIDADNTIPTLRRIGDVAAGIGAPIGEIAEVYGKARVQGRLFAEDINQLTGRGIPIIGELAKQFGVTESEVRGLVESGKVNFGHLEQAFISLTSEGGKFEGLMEAQSQTIAGLWSTLKDNVGLALVSLGKSIIETFDLKDVIGNVIERVERIASAFSDFAARVEEAGLKETLNEIFSEKTKMIIVIVAGAITGALVPAFISLAAAAWAAMIPLLPFIAVGAAIAGLAYLIYKNWDKISGFFVNIWETVKNAAIAAWEWIKNTFFNFTPLGLIIKNWDKIVAFFANLPGIIGNALSAAGAWLLKFFTEDLPYWIGFAIGTIIRFFLDLPGNIWEGLKMVDKKLGEWAVIAWNWAKEAGSKLVTNFINWVKELPGNVWTWLVQTAQKIPVWGGQLWTYATLAAGRLVSGIMTAINNLPGQIWDVMVSAAKKLLDIGSTFYNYAKKAAENAWKGFKAGLGIKSPSLIEKALFAIQDTARETIGMMQHDFGSLSRLQVPVNIAMAGAGAGTVTVNHTGTLRVEGVNDKGQLVGFVNIFMDTLDKSPTLRRKISEASGRNYRDITRGQGG